MVVEVDVVGDASANFVHGSEDVSVEVLVLEDRPEALGAGVVVTTTRGAHGPNDLDRRAEFGGLAVAELAAAVGVKDRASDVPKSSRDRLVE